MAENSGKWWRDLMVLPVAVGILLAVVSFGLPKIFPDEKELSYKVAGPSVYVGPAPATGQFAGKQAAELPPMFATTVKVWNSGDLPLKDLAVRFHLTSHSPHFQILLVDHYTRPAMEFGAITANGGDEKSKRFVYELFNPGDADTVTIFSTAQVDVEVFSKAESLSLSLVPSGSGFTHVHLILTTIFSYLLTKALMAVLAIVPQLYRAHRRLSAAWSYTIWIWGDQT